jgi:hypothetical protein
VFAKKKRSERKSKKIKKEKKKKKKESERGYIVDCAIASFNFRSSSLWFL